MEEAMMSLRTRRLVPSEVEQVLSWTDAHIRSDLVQMTCEAQKGSDMSCLTEILGAAFVRTWLGFRVKRNLPKSMMFFDYLVAIAQPPVTGWKDPFRQYLVYPSSLHLSS